VRSLRSGLAGELVAVAAVVRMSRIVGTRNPAGQRVTNCPVEVRANADGAIILGARVTRPAVHKRCTLLA
jgi:hypothetical protein